METSDETFAAQSKQSTQNKVPSDLPSPPPSAAIEKADYHVYVAKKRNRRSRKNVPMLSEK